MEVLNCLMKRARISGPGKNKDGKREDLGNLMAHHPNQLILWKQFPKLPERYRLFGDQVQPCRNARRVQGIHLCMAKEIP